MSNISFIIDFKEPSDLFMSLQMCYITKVNFYALNFSLGHDFLSLSDDTIDTYNALSYNIYTYVRLPYETGGYEDILDKFRKVTPIYHGLNDDKSNNSLCYAQDTPFQRRYVLEDITLDATAYEVSNVKVFDTIPNEMLTQKYFVNISHDFSKFLEVTEVLKTRTTF